MENLSPQSKSDSSEQSPQERKSASNPSLGVLMRAHFRADTLDIALNEFLRYKDELGIDVRIHLLADRPNFLVQQIIEKYYGKLFCLRYAPFPLVSSQGERFMEALNLQLDAFRHGDVPDWFCIADDDRWLEPNRANRFLREALTDPDVDAYYVKSLFVWDRPDLYNASRHHDSIAFFRYLQDDRFPTDRVIQATERRHDDAIMTNRVARLPVPYLDYGTYKEDERKRLYGAFINAGKDDPYIKNILEEPNLQPLPFGDDWRDLYTEYHARPKEPTR